MYLTLITVVTSVCAVNYPKCCNFNSVLIENNCFETENKSVQILTKNTNFVKENTKGKCVEISGNQVNLYEISNSNVVGNSEINVNFFPKCCPFNYHYSSRNHSCFPSLNKLNFSETFLKVGLANCKIIQDFRFTHEANLSLLHKKQKKQFGDGKYCVDLDENLNYISRGCKDNYKVCNSIRCIHKCCPDGQSFVNGSHCVFTYKHGLNLNFSKKIVFSENFAIVHGYKPSIYPLSFKSDFYLDSNGIFSLLEHVDGHNLTNQYDVFEDIYCIEHAYKKSKNMNSFFIFRRFVQETLNMKFMYTGYAMTISCVFLALTILYYILTKEKNTLFGKILVSYCLVIFVTFLLLSFTTFSTISDRLCKIFTFIILYLVLASFTWLNIMCIDIYWAFGSKKLFAVTQYKPNELKRFLLFSVYGWGFPFVLTALPLILYCLDVLPPIIRIVLDGHKCYFEKRIHGSYAFLLFVTAPLGILELCNLILFVKTVIFCLKVKGEIGTMNDTQVLKREKTRKFNNYKDRLSLVFKLFIIMGITFLFEIISTFVDFKINSTTAIIETVLDTFNSLQGVFIFLIFICKKRVFDRLKKKIPNARKSSLSSATTLSVINSSKQ